MEYETSIKELLSNALRDARTVMDTDTVVGDPICLDNGITVIPISRVAMGFASGGLDFPSNRAGARKNFGGGGGTGVTVSPVGFLVVDPTGAVDFINVNQKGAPDPVDQIADLVERVPDLIARIKELFIDDRKHQLDENF